MISNHSFKAVDLSILGISGFLMVLGLLAAVLAIPWNIQRWRQSGALQLNVLWPSRVLLAITIIFWAACQTLRLDNIWGSNAIFLPPSASQWSGQGWLCRIYLTTTLGITAPLTAFLTIHILATGVRRQQVGELELANPTQYQTKTNLKLLLAALLCTLPITLAQIAIAWISVWVKDGDGNSFESQPRSLLGYFFATFWYANNPSQQCTVLINIPPSADAGGDVGEQNCTMCYFPAAAVIVHAVWSLAFLTGVWILYKALTKKAVNTTITRRLLFFCAMMTGFVVGGVAALGASIAFDPFGWVNQGLWIGYALSVAGCGLVMIVFMVLLPSATLRYVSWNMHKYNDKLFSSDTINNNNNATNGLTYLHHSSPSSPYSWVHIHPSSNNKAFPGTPYDSALTLSTNTTTSTPTATTTNSRSLNTKTSNNSSRITPLPLPPSSSDYMHMTTTTTGGGGGSVVGTVDSTAASYPSSLFPQPPAALQTHGSGGVRVSPRQYYWSQNSTDQIDSGTTGTSGLLRSNTSVQQQYQQQEQQYPAAAVPSGSSTSTTGSTTTTSYWSSHSHSHSAESPATSMYGSGMKSSTTSRSPTQYQYQQYQYPQRPVPPHQPYSSHFRVQSQSHSSPYRTRSGINTPATGTTGNGSPVAGVPSAVVPRVVLPVSTRPYSAGGFGNNSLLSSSGNLGRPYTAGGGGVSQPPTSSLPYHQYRNAAAAPGSPFSHRPNRPTSQHHHHQQQRSTTSHGGGSSSSLQQQQHGVVDTKPITNPLWFQSGLPPSYHHSPSSSAGS